MYLLYGAGKLGVLTLKKLTCAQIYGFIDNDKQKEGTMVQGYPVISFQSFRRLFSENQSDIDGVIICIAEHKEVVRIIHNMKNIGVKDVYVMSPEKINTRIVKDNMLDKSALPYVNTDVKPYLPYVEFHLADHCNLNCKGCAHYSNLLEKPVFLGVESFQNDFEQLSKLYTIGKIRLLGGEPLLNSNLVDIIRIIRRMDNVSNLRILTNGLIFSDLPKTTLEAMSYYDCQLSFSPYAPTIKQKERIERICESYEITFSWTPPIEKFRKFLTANIENNPYDALQNCICGFSSFVYDGHISRCPTIPLTIKYFNKRFNTDFKSDEVYDLYHIDDPWAMVEKLYSDEPADFCKYCSDTISEYPWTCGRIHPQMEDWIN
jgi:organic radical activating enzyme